MAMPTIPSIGEVIFVKPRFNSAVLTIACDDCTCAFAEMIAVFAVPTAAAAVGTAKTAIISAKAQVQSSQAMVRTAELNLGFTKITSPIDGIVGIAMAQV